MKKHNRMTVADLGKRQMTMLFVETPDEAAAAAAAGIDILSIIEPIWTPEMREAAGNCFVQVGLIYGRLCTYEDYLRAAHAAKRAQGGHEIDGFENVGLALGVVAEEDVESGRKINVQPRVIAEVAETQMGPMH